MRKAFAFASALIASMSLGIRVSQLNYDDGDESKGNFAQVKPED